MTLPIVVVATFVIAALGRHSGGSSGSTASGSTGSSGAPLPAVTVSPPPSDPAAAAPCSTLVDRLPLDLGGLPARPVVSQPSSSFVVGWGDPAIVLRCGVPRPAGLTRNAQVFAVDGVNVLPHKQDGATVFTVIDRPVYIEITVPSAYAQPPLGPIAKVIAANLRQVCSANQAGQSPLPRSQLCVNRR